MLKLYNIIAFVTGVIMLFLFVFTNNTYAVSNGLLISQIQLGNPSSATNEFIELYNNGDSDIEVTNWCLYYASASSVQNGSKLTCFNVDNPSLHLFLPSHQYIFAISNQLANSTPSLASDFKFSATLSGTAGHVRLIDSIGNEIDKVGWGNTAVSAEGLSPSAVPPVGKILHRKSSSLTTLQDTDINKDDFEVVIPDLTYSYGSVYEVQDLCTNIDGIQSIVPVGYSADIVGSCTPLPVDVCSNLDGLQATLPVGYKFDTDGSCRADVCPNIDGLQLALPDKMRLDESGDCILFDIKPLVITELLPNAVGSDDGNEFIEIYNPNDVDIDLANYKLHIGINDIKIYSFPDGAQILAGQYLKLSNDDVKFTLVNTSSSVGLYFSDGTAISDVVSYTNPSDGIAWALIDGQWQYTNQPTPGAANLASLIDDTNKQPVEEVTLAPCPSGQYRNPETNRCRQVVTSSSTLVQCKDGQYRSEETNRCRNIVDDVVTLTPCAEGQERNPDTNRCRAVTADVLGDNTLAPCKEGQERNPETNRCRNIVSNSVPDAQYAPELVAQTSSNNIVWWALAGVGTVATLYAIWEWKHEIAILFKKLRLFRQSDK